MDITIPTFKQLLSSIPKEHLPSTEEDRMAIQGDIYKAYMSELQMMLGMASNCTNPQVVMGPFFKRGLQFIAEFYVNDMNKPLEEKYNFHLQNTSRWVYAGCILYQDGQVSRHH
jgi:hypothetical protein